MLTRRGAPSDEKTRRRPSADDGALSVLVVVAGRATRHPLPASGAVTFGRDAACEVPIDDDSVSRRHARLHAGSPPELEDLGSTNGTRVGAELLLAHRRVPLPVGVVAEIGAATVLVQRGGAESADIAVQAPSREVGRHDPDAVVRAPAMKQLYALLETIAPSQVPVLILGETGVGKEVFAHALHVRSRRADRPFLAIHCAALSESVLESELFGHERGAFTGAVQSKPGLFEAADGGTVFLDELGEMPLATQAKLLRVLESGEVLRVGSVKPRTVDVRVLSATNRDVAAEVAAGRFRSDLFFRLDGITVILPPLRDRKEDVEPLARRFLEEAARREGKPGLDFAPSAIEALLAHPWPGNVRELRSAITRAVLLCRSDAIDGALVSSAAARASVPPPAPRVSAPPPSASSLRGELDAIERERILEALARCGGNQTRAAKMLGIGRRTLINRIEAYGIARPLKGGS